MLLNNRGEIVNVPHGVKQHVLAPLREVLRPLHSHAKMFRLDQRARIVDKRVQK